jgi:hypothetical protein
MAFIKFNDLEFVQPQHQEMVKEHLFARIPAVHSTESLKLMDGVFNIINENDMVKWLDPYIRAITSTSIKSKDKTTIRQYLLFATDYISSNLEERIDRRLDDWIRHYEKEEMPDRVTVVRELKDDINSQRIPF